MPKMHIDTNTFLGKPFDFLRMYLIGISAIKSTIVKRVEPSPIKTSRLKSVLFNIEHQPH